jgi:acylphosphatase
MDGTTMTDTLTRRVVVEGFVQGVGYRDFARRVALRRRISGWVRNRTDGTVEALIRGAPSDIEAMLSELRRGPRGARITSVRLAEPRRGDEIEPGAFHVRATL